VPTGSFAYTADRWFAQNDSGGDATVTQASAPAGFRGLNAIRIQAPMSAGSIAGWGQRFEGQMVRDLDGKNVVVSFDLSQSVSGGATTTWYLQLFGNTALDNGTFSTTLFSTTFTPPASAGVVSIAIPAASTVGLKYGAHFRVVAVRTSGSGTLDAYLGSVQFEADRLVGGNWNNPTPFEFRPLPVELTMCQRYFETSYDDGMAPGTAAILGSSVSTRVTDAAGSWGTLPFGFRVRKRVSPTMVMYSPTTGAAGKIDNSGVGDIAGTFQFSDRNGALAQVGGVAYGAGAQLSLHWTANAEL
jgi:hypothetical protein